MLKEARASECHQGNSYFHLRLIVALIKSQRSGIRLRCDLDEPMAYVMAIGNEVSGECVEAINVDQVCNNKRLGFSALWDIRLSSVGYGGGTDGGQAS